jgi:hypothetical protein
MLMYGNIMMLWIEARGLHGLEDTGVGFAQASRGLLIWLSQWLDSVKNCVSLVGGRVWDV